FDTIHLIYGELSITMQWMQACLKQEIDVIFEGHLSTSKSSARQIGTTHQIRTAQSTDTEGKSKLHGSRTVGNVLW
ncbi:MAG: hypothetical protein Q9212_003188, partial [Teloschistes hypoglaucus]